MSFGLRCHQRRVGTGQSGRPHWWAAMERVCIAPLDTLVASEALSAWVLSVHLVKRSVIFSVLLTLP